MTSHKANLIDSTRENQRKGKTSVNFIDIQLNGLCSEIKAAVQELAQEKLLKTKKTKKTKKTEEHHLNHT